jgi:membrane protease YdiL (CAAX protease family)
MSHRQLVVVRDKPTTLVAALLCGTLLVIAFFRGVFSEYYWAVVCWTFGMAFIEEIVFRRWLMMRLIRSIGLRLAVVVSSLIFAAAHSHAYGASPALIAIFLGSICLSFAYLASGSLALVIALHGLENLTVRMSQMATVSTCAEISSLTCVQIAGAVNITTWCALSVILVLYGLKLLRRNLPPLTPRVVHSRCVPPDKSGKT